MLVVLRRAGLAAVAALLSVFVMVPAQVSAVDSPVVSSVSPNRGSDSGGETVTLKGSGFYCGTGGPVVSGDNNPVNGHAEPPPHDYLNVYFGNAAANILSTPSDGEMTVTTPAGEGTVDVTVTCVAGNTVSSAPNAGDRFSYVSSLGGGGSLGQPKSGSSDAASSSSLPSSLAQTGGGPAARFQAASLPLAPALVALLILAAGWLLGRRLGRR